MIKGIGKIYQTCLDEISYTMYETIQGKKADSTKSLETSIQKKGR